MRIVEVREHALPISRYADPAVPPGGLTTSAVAVITDVIRGGHPVIGYGFASMGRFAQGGLIRERFAPRLLAAREGDLVDQAGTNLDPFRAGRLMMAGEKPGGHGERCVAVGTLDMALWDAAAKIAGVPLYRHLADRLGQIEMTSPQIAVYAGGGYYYPTDDVGRLSDEIRGLRDLGYHRVKIKIGGAPLRQDLKRIDAAARLLPDASHLAVDAIYSYTSTSSLEAADALAPLGLWWFEDICDPLDFETLAAVAARYAGPIAAGEALFSTAEAKLLDRYAGLRPTEISCCSIPSTVMGFPATWRLSKCSKRAAGRGLHFGRTAGISSVCTVCRRLRFSSNPMPGTVGGSVAPTTTLISSP